MEGVNMTCAECYSDDPRVTPILDPEKCLKTHRQYICSTCGRCICAEVDKNNKFRARFPFKTVEIAKLYLRSAEALYEGPCEIYKINYKNGRIFYRIFKNKDDLREHLRRNPDQECETMSPLYKSPAYLPPALNQMRKLASKEIEAYLEQKLESRKV
jgi:hypothetical protein